MRVANLNWPPLFLAHFIAFFELPRFFFFWCWYLTNCVSFCLVKSFRFLHWGGQEGGDSTAIPHRPSYTCRTSLPCADVEFIPLLSWAVSTLFFFPLKIIHQVLIISFAWKLNLLAISDLKYGTRKNRYHCTKETHHTWPVGGWIRTIPLASHALDGPWSKNFVDCGILANHSRLFLFLNANY